MHKSSLPHHRPTPNRHATNPLKNLRSPLPPRRSLNKRLRHIQLLTLIILFIIRRLREVIGKLCNSCAQVAGYDDRVDDISVLLTVQHAPTLRQRIVDFPCGTGFVVVDGEERVDQPPEISFSGFELLVEDGAIAVGRGMLFGFGFGFRVKVLAEDEVLEDLEALGGVVDTVVDFEIGDLAVGWVRGVGDFAGEGHEVPDDFCFEAVRAGCGGEVVGIGGADVEALD